ncbi:MAG: L-histidine N(alpha)-methyltransferase [Gemmataceae bacterium]
MSNSAAKNVRHERAPQALSGDTEQRLEKIWKRAYTAKSKEDLLGLYADWAEKYDEDHEAVGFFGHVSASRLLVKHLDSKRQAAVLDAGAGTGAAGVALAALGLRNLTALDLSPHMLAKAEEKGVYRRLVQANLGLPVDALPINHFDAAILVGVFSYGQAPAHALEEILPLVKPGGLIVFTMRTDFHDADAMGVRSKMAELERQGAWQAVEVTEPELYLPNKDPRATFRVWCYRVRAEKFPPVDQAFASAVRSALTAPTSVKRLDHRYIWNSRASRLYNRYIETREYYLNDSEEEILRTNATDIINDESTIVELGCGSARKVKYLLSAADRRSDLDGLTYVPIDLSPGALKATRQEVDSCYQGRIAVEPLHASFARALPAVAERQGKLLLFFGSSIGNIESLEETVAFLKRVRACMGPRDRFVVGMDLHKDEEVLRSAYQAGEANLVFFLNMVRRINHELDARFDLSAFEQDSSYDEDEPYQGIEDRCVNFTLVTRKPQRVRVDRLDLDVELDAGDSIQVGISRKFRREDIQRLAALAGFRLARQWQDRRHYFSVNELLPA